MAAHRRPLSRILRCPVTVFLFFIITAFYLAGLYLVYYSTVLREQKVIQSLPENHYVKLDQRFELLNYQTHTDASNNYARKNIIIVSHGRSGSTFTGDIFNHHPDVFYMYEPLQTVLRTQINYGNKMGCGLNCVQEFLRDIFRCNFNDPKYLEDINFYYRKPDHPRVSRAIASPPLCPYNMTDPRWHPSLCPPMTSESMGETCKKSYDMTVIKVLMGRMPDVAIEKILAGCNHKEVNCKIVFLVRDPRAVIPSASSVSFFHEHDDLAKSATRHYSYQQCRKTEENLVYVRNLPQNLRSKIKLLRYEDLASNPLLELKGLYDFAGLSELQSVKTWVNETTRTSVEHCGTLGVVCTKDDAKAAVNRWRWKVHPHVINIIEHYCSHVMQLLGYRPIGYSYELQRNIRISLVSKTFEVQNWI